MPRIRQRKMLSPSAGFSISTSYVTYGRNMIHAKCVYKETNKKYSRVHNQHCDCQGYLSNKQVLAIEVKKIIKLRLWQNN